MEGRLVAYIMLQTSLQTNVLQIRAVSNSGIQHIFQHSTVHFIILNFCGYVSPGDVEDVSNICEL